MSIRSPNKDADKLLKLVVSGFKHLDKSLEGVKNKNIDLVALDIRIDNATIYTSYTLVKYDSQIKQLSTSDAKIAIKLLKPIQGKLRKASEILIDFDEESSQILIPNFKRNSKGFGSDINYKVSQSKWSIAFKYLYNLVDEAKDKSDRFIEFMEKKNSIAAPISQPETKPR